MKERRSPIQTRNDGSDSTSLNEVRSMKERRCSREFPQNPAKVRLNEVRSMKERRCLLSPFR